MLHVIAAPPPTALLSSVSPPFLDSFLTKSHIFLCERSPMYRSTLQTQYASWRLHATTVLLSSGDILLCTVCTVLWGWGSYHDKNNITFSFVSYNLRLFGWYNLVILQTLIYPAWIEHFRNLFSHLESALFFLLFSFFFPLFPFLPPSVWFSSVWFSSSSYLRYHG